MDFEQIKELIKLVTKSKVSEFKYEDESSKFSIRTKSFTNSKEVIVQQPPMVSGVQMPMASQPAVQPQVAAPAADTSAADSKGAEKKRIPLITLRSSRLWLVHSTAHHRLKKVLT